MAKRFTDTGKWDKAWFRRLDPTLKCAWIYLCDRCDHAGVWEIDEDALEFFVGRTIPLDRLVAAFGEKVRRVGDKLVLGGFADFQYGDLNPENRVHKSVLNRLEKLSQNKDLLSPLEGAKDKDTDKDKDKFLRGGVGEIKFKPDLDSIYARYPRKEGKSRGIAILKASVKGPADFVECNTALDNFLAHHKRKGTEAEFLPHFKTWAGSWRDWLDPDTGQAENFADPGKTYDWADITGSDPKGAA